MQAEQEILARRVSGTVNKADLCLMQMTQKLKPQNTKRKIHTSIPSRGSVKVEGKKSAVAGMRENGYTYKHMYSIYNTCVVMARLIVMSYCIEKLTEIEKDQSRC